MKISEQILSQFRDAIGESSVCIDEEQREKYSHDETENLRFTPQVVLKPRNTFEISSIMKICFQHSIPVTPIGAQTGLSGGALCTHGGVALAMERLNEILKIDTRNHQVHVQPGVITQELQEAVAKHDLYYAPDPASRGSCFIGGNLAENSGGPRAVKYGVTKDWVLNLEVVLPNGEIIQTGADTLKNSTGYNLTQLFVGSEGTLGIITKAVLKLIPQPKMNKLMLAEFESAEDACAAVSAIFMAGITPSALEFMERDAIALALKFVDQSFIQLGDTIGAHLLIEVDGGDEDLLFSQCEKIAEVLEGFNCKEIHFAESESQKEQLWQLRRKVGEAVKAYSVYKEEDTVVPRFALPQLLKGVKIIGAKYGFQSVCYGHAGDGNLHVNILKSDLSDEVWNNSLHQAITEIFELTLSLGGMLSGEHGIGHVQRPYMKLAFSEAHLQIFKQIKKVFDPKNIMNPDKIF